MVGEKCSGCISLEWTSASHLKWMKPHWSGQTENCFSQALVSWAFSVWISCRDYSGLGRVLGWWSSVQQPLPTTLPMGSVTLCMFWLCTTCFCVNTCTWHSPHTGVHVQRGPVSWGCRKMTQLWFKCRWKSMHLHKHLSGRCGSCSLFVSKLLLAHFLEQLNKKKKNLIPLCEKMFRAAQSSNGWFQ